MDHAFSLFHPSKLQTIECCGFSSLSFFCVFLTVLGLSSPIAKHIVQCLPSSLYTANKIRNKSTFKKYVVYRRCHQIYRMAACLDKTTKTSKVCPLKPFPWHTHQTMRRSCDKLLLKTVELASGRTHLYPFLTYCCVGLEQSLQHLLDRPNFYDQCGLGDTVNQEQTQCAMCTMGKYGKNFYLTIIRKLSGDDKYGFLSAI